MQPSAPRDVLQGVHNSITDMVKEVANEPSVGLYFVQQHVHKAVPGLLALKGQVAEGTNEAILYTEDVKDALTAVKVMKEVGPPVFSKMISTLNASLQLLPTLYHPKTSSRPPPAYAHLPRSATHHGALTFSGLQQGTKGDVPSESSIQEKSSLAFSPAEGLPAVSSRSLPSQDNANPSSTTQTDASGYVSGLFNSAYQRASSVRMSMPVAFEVKERSAKQDNATEVTTTSNPLAKSASTPGSSAGYIPSIPYWNVFESAIQKAGHMVGAGSNGSGGVSDSFHKSSLVRSVSASNLRESAHKKSSVPSVEASDSGVSSSTRVDDSLTSNGSKQVHKFEEQRLPGSTESKLTDWLRLPSTALRNLSRREGTETDGRGDQLDREAFREQESLEEGDDKEHTGLDLEDPQVVESYARLQAEQAAKLEAWLDDSKEDEATPES